MRTRAVRFLGVFAAWVAGTRRPALFGNGHGVGLEALRELVGRVNERFGERVEWTTPSAIARKALAEAANA